MSNASFPAGRRQFLASLGLLGVTALAACRSVLPAVEAMAASRAAAQTVADLRAGHGLLPLAPDPALEKAALAQVGYMALAGRMEHTALAGRDFVSRLRAGGIRGPAAENLAHGRMDIDRLFAIWMGSPPHRRNMLDPRFARFGLGYAADGGDGRYWALVLAA